MLKKIKVLLLLKTKQSRLQLLTTFQLCNSGQVTSTQRALVSLPVECACLTVVCKDQI